MNYLNDIFLIYRLMKNLNYLFLVLSLIRYLNALFIISSLIKYLNDLFLISSLINYLKDLFLISGLIKYLKALFFFNLQTSFKVNLEQKISWIFYYTNQFAVCFPIRLSSSLNQLSKAYLRYKIADVLKIESDQTYAVSTGSHKVRITVFTTFNIFLKLSWHICPSFTSLPSVCMCACICVCV